ncbi:MAG: hypothetical protein EOO04_27085 [Chitinophagaceae bacterium]|nr:MAG: hypothetical protein EOO04_27085 [Chitinophagaceae bacterium]
MKTYQNPGSVKRLVSKSKKLLLPILIIILSLPVYSQELAIVKSSFQHTATLTPWTEAVKNKEGGIIDWTKLARNNSYAHRLITEKNMDVLENSLNVCLDNRKAVINWSSYQDINTTFYVIERSVNGQSFKEIAQIFTSPDATAKFDYQYFDKLTPDVRGAIYYRLKIVDQNSQPVYTPAQLASSNKSYENLMVSLKN